MFSNLEATLLTFAEKVPLEVFAFFGSFLEEVIAPIPSSGVLLATGTLAAAQGLSTVALLPLILLATLGKTIGAVIIFVVAKKLGSRFIDRFGRFFGVRNDDITSFGERHLSGRNQFWSLLILRMLPIFPSAILSVGCGMLRINTKVYVTTTILGTIIRDSFFLLIGFTGLEILHAIASYSTKIESYVQFFILVTVLVLMLYIFRKKIKSKL